MGLRLVPVDWATAQAFVATWHRHHNPPTGWKFGVGVATDGDVLVGVATVGRPVAHHLQDGLTLEVNRTATDGYPNANSMLYGACGSSSVRNGLPTPNHLYAGRRVRGILAGGGLAGRRPATGAVGLVDAGPTSRPGPRSFAPHVVGSLVMGRLVVVSPGPITEKEWMGQVRELASMLGWAFYHPFLSIHSPRGWPDVALCRPPRLIFAELKSSAGKLTPAQAEWLGLLEGCPQVEVYLWRPDDLDDVTRILR